MSTKTCYSDISCTGTILNLDPNCGIDANCSIECYDVLCGKSYKTSAGFCFTNPDPNTCSSSTGDPHMKTWGNHHKYDYHGECDLIAIQDYNFLHGLGLHLHLRTTRDQHYSFVNEAALQIGDDVLEVHSLGRYKLNGIFGDMTNTTTAKFGGFDFLHHHDDIFSRFYIQLNNDGDNTAYIEMWTYENIIYTKVAGNDGMFDDSMGMFGNGKNGKMFNRHGTIEITDPNEFANEWQVRNTDPMLFQNVRPPQFPNPCLPPKKFIPRLGEKYAIQQAKKICYNWNEDNQDECVFDVVATRNNKIAKFNIVQEAFKMEQEQLGTMN